MTRTLTTQPSDTQEPDSLDDTIEVITSGQPEGHGFRFKVRTSGRVYRLDSARDPRQPRFWCFRVTRCGSAGTVDITERPWYGGEGMTRDDLPAAVAAIRAAPAKWLALPDHVGLRDWVLEDLPLDAVGTIASQVSGRQARVAE